MAPLHLLEVDAISKHFGGVQASHDVTMSVAAGEIFGLVGPNGAGKTTLFNCLCGQLRSDGGSVRFAGELIDKLPSYVVAGIPVAALSLGHCRLVELGRALAGKPRLLMADEPSSGLDVQETRALADTLRHVRQEHGTTVVIVEHDLDMVSQVVDRVIVHDFGQQIASGTVTQVLADPVVRKAYLGKKS